MAKETLDAVRSYSRYVNARDWDGYRALFTPDVVITSQAARRVVHGPDAAVEAVQKTLSALPDAHIEVVNAFAAGDQAVVESILSGTQPDAETGEPKRVSAETCHVFRLRDGKIARVTVYSSGVLR